MDGFRPDASETHCQRFVSKFSRDLVQGGSRRRRSDGCCPTGQHLCIIDHMSKPERVADLLRSARQAKGESLRSAAKAIGVDPSYLSRVEGGEKAPSEALRERVRSHYDLDRDVLALAAGDVPEDVLVILQRHPEALKELRERYARSG